MKIPKKVIILLFALHFPGFADEGFEMRNVQSRVIAVLEEGAEMNFIILTHKRMEQLFLTDFESKIINISSIIDSASNHQGKKFSELAAEMGDLRIKVSAKDQGRIIIEFIVTTSMNGKVADDIYMIEKDLQYFKSLLRNGGK